VLGNRVEPRGTRQTAMTLVQLGELTVSEVEEKVRVEEFAVLAKQPDEQLHRPDIGDHPQMIADQPKDGQPS
jgi:hypothetical protein